MVLLLLYMSVFNTFGDSLYSYTVDDLRDLIGKERVDTIYTEDEIFDIINKYNEIERENLYAKMFEMGKDIDISSKKEEELKEVEKKIEVLSSELERMYKEGYKVKEVLSIKTELDGYIHKMDSLQIQGYYISLDYKVNKWSEEYEKVQETIKEMDKDYEIGALGDDMRSPVYTGFLITSPYGFRVDPILKTELSFHSGLDLAGSKGDYVLSMWHGIVSNVYESEQGGKTVEISHGPDLITRYLHLENIDVTMGQKVQQYDIIGGVGSTGTRSTGNHLHLEVLLDGEYVNPLLVFGNMGLRAFKEYLSYNPSRNRELTDIEKVIKGSPTKEGEDKEVVMSKYYRPSVYVEGSIPTIVVGGGEITPFKYGLPLALSEAEQELIDYIDEVLRKREEGDSGVEDVDNKEEKEEEGG